MDVTKGATKDTLFIVNAVDPKTLPISSANIYAVDALGISLAETGNDVPNAAMLGALAKAGLVDIDTVADTIERKFGSKGAANAKAARRAYAETRRY